MSEVEVCLILVPTYINRQKSDKLLFSLPIQTNVFFSFQGDLEDAHKDKDSKTVFITCHDIGNNHYSFSVRVVCNNIRKKHFLYYCLVYLNQGL